MSLSSVASLQNVPGLTAYTTAQMQQALDAADQCVKHYCHRDLESASYTDYLDGNGQQYLPLRQRPVTTLTSVNLDPAGWYGKGPNAFPTASLLTEGRDFVMKYSGGGNTQSKQALLIRLGGGITGSTLDAIWPWEWRKGSLTMRLPPVWPAGLGNLKIVYTAGFLSIPADVTMAVNMIAAFMLRTAAFGGRFLSSESWNGYSFALSQLQMRPELGEARDILSRYRELTI